jgi:hypothetical protein
VSEYQYLAFRAVDRRLTERELAFARKQSTRAEITPWALENEYHFGDFHGDAKGLLRRGFDAHLHYANFGIRRIAFRLPAGLPFPKRVWSQYIGVGELKWIKDRKGKGGIVSLDPFHEASELDEIWEPGAYMEDVVQIRDLLAAGDLRILYLLWLCVAVDDQSVSPDIVEPPVPAGLAEGGRSFEALLDFFGLDPLLLVAASEGVPAPPEHLDRDERIGAWVDALGQDESKQFLRRLLLEDATSVKAELIAASLDSKYQTDWPSVALGRSFNELLERTEVLRAEQETKQRKKQEAAAKREAAKREQQRKRRMKEMVKAPKKWIGEVEKLVEARGTQNYKSAAEILADLRKAIGGDEGEKIARKHAAHLARRHPTLTHLKSSLRKQGLLE